MTQKTSVNGGLNLSLLVNTATVTLKGKNCLVIPIDDNPALFVGKKGVYLDISVVETPDSQYGHTHYVRANIGSSRRGGYSKEALKAMTPILGDLKAVQAAAAAAEPQQDLPQGTVNGPEDDLPW